MSEVILAFLILMSSTSLSNADDVDYSTFETDHFTIYTKGEYNNNEFIEFRVNRWSRLVDENKKREFDFRFEYEDESSSIIEEVDNELL